MRIPHPRSGPDEHRRRGPAAATAALLISGMVCLATSSPAQEAETPETYESRQTASMREAVYKELARAQEDVDAERYADALRRLNELSGGELNSYERAQVWNLFAFVYYAQERHQEAIAAFEKVLREKDLYPAIESAAVFNLAQLYVVTENWRRAREMLQRWFASAPDPQPQHYELLAQTHYQLGEYREAIAPMRKAMELRRAAGEAIEERVYLFLRVVYYELGQLDQVVAVLQELIKRFPSEKYWLQLASAYGEKGDEKKQLGTLEVAYLQGHLDTQPELLSLVGLLLNHDLPYRAGTVLARGLEQGVLQSTLENWRLLAQAWTLAKEDEKAVPALRRAATLSKDGELDLILAQTFMNLEQWQEAAGAARAAIRKGGLRRPDEAYILLGQALFSTDAFDEARAAFENARRDGQSSRLASQWLRYIDSEVERRAQLKAALEE